MGPFSPDRYFSRVSRIDVDRDLLGRGLRFVFLDIDNTIRRRDNREVPIDVRAWIGRAREKGAVVCLLSNNCHADVYDLEALTKEHLDSFWFEPVLADGTMKKCDTIEELADVMAFGDEEKKTFLVSVKRYRV